MIINFVYLDVINLYKSESTYHSWHPYWLFVAQIGKMKLIVLLALVGVAVAIPNPFSPFGPGKTGTKNPDMIIPDFNKGKSNILLPIKDK